MLRPIATSSNHDGWSEWEDFLHFLSLMWFRYLLRVKYFS